jgi:hypothetical protein
MSSSTSITGPRRRLRAGLPQVLEDAAGLATSGGLRVEKGEHASRRRSVLEDLDPGDQRTHGLDHRGERDVGLEVEQCPTETVKPRPTACCSAWFTRVVLPIPASPPTRTVCGVPRAAAADLAQLRDLYAASNAGPAISVHR